MLEVGRLTDADLEQRVAAAAEVAGPALPVERRAERLQLGVGLEVVGLDDVAGLGALPVALGQPGLQAQHGRGCALGVVVPDQAEHGRQVGDVLVADLGELVVAVVGLVGQAEPALHEVDDVALGVAVVVVDVGPEDAAAAGALELAEEAGQLAYVAQLGGGVEHRLERLQAELLDRGLVHERGVEHGDLAGVLDPAAPCRRPRRPGTR